MEDEDLEYLCDRINNLIEEAVKHGGDAGGAYYTNQKGLINSLINLLSCLNIYDKTIIYNADVPKVLEKSKLKENEVLF